MPEETPNPPLLRTPTNEEQALIDEIAAVFFRHERWPSWAYLEETLERRNMRAWTVLHGLPAVGQWQYSYVWPFRPTEPTADSQIGLTVAGLGKYGNDQVLIRRFIEFVRGLGVIRSEVPLDPFANDRPRVSHAQYHARWTPHLPYEPAMLEMMTHEPPTWQCHLTQSSGDWTIELSPVVRRFFDINSVEEYLDHFWLLMPPREKPKLVHLESPFTLPASLDYLDVVWQLHFKKPLIEAPGVERSALLAFDATTPDEVDSRLSALGEFLKNLRIPSTPGVEGHPLTRLGPFLKGKLPEECHERIERAVSILSAVWRLRTGAQHFSAQSHAAEAYEQFRLIYPIHDWPATWDHVQNVVASAVDAIRQEIQAGL